MEVTTNNTHTNKKTSLRQLRWGDILLFLLISAIACYIRFVLRNIVAGDYKMFFEPWVAILRQAGGGIKGLAAEFEYVDYTTPYLTILSFISICPFLNTLLLMKIVSILFDFSAAFAVMAITFHHTKNWRTSIFAYGALLLAPTVIANSAMWAQCDIIFTSFVLWSIYFMLEDKPAVSMIFYGIAFAFKLQTFFILPLYVIFWMKKKMKLWHFIFVPVMYIVGMIPALIAGKDFWELLTVYFFQAGGLMDIYALSHKFPNIYQLFGTDAFLIEYADAGIYVTLAALMAELYIFAFKKYQLHEKLILRMGMMLTMTVVFFLPHMHERYAILVDVLAIAYFFYEPDKLYIPVLTVLCSFAGYTIYLAQNNIFPLAVYTILFLGLMADHGRYCMREILKISKQAGKRQES
ncbi:MAG: hypothetical protein K6E75_01695 [Lachnospiraceae bacterium]|nr:hypothetical protein [Lachnospiraceae bacterium]